MQKYHQLFQISQEKYDRLANLAGSGGAVGLKDSDVIDPSLVEVEFTRALQSESLSSGGKGDNSNLKVFCHDFVFSYSLQSITIKKESNLMVFDIIIFVLATCTWKKKKISLIYSYMHQKWFH